MVGWLVSSIGALILAKMFASLAARFPRSDGPYEFSKEGFGGFAEFFVAWGYWISVSATNAAVAVAMVSYLTVFFRI